MAKLNYTSSKGMFLLSVAAILVYSVTAFAQSAKDTCGPTSVIPLTGKEPPAKIIAYPPLAEPLASRGVAIIQYCTQNLHLVPGRLECLWAAALVLGKLASRNALFPDTKFVAF